MGGDGSVDVRCCGYVKEGREEGPDYAEGDENEIKVAEGEGSGDRVFEL